MSYTSLLATPFALFIGSSALADLNQDALNKSQAVIHDNNRREEHVQAMPEQSQKALGMLRAMGMNKEQEDQLFGIAADAFSGMMKNVNGDTKQLQQALAGGLSDPKKFLKSMSGVHQERLRELSSQVEGFNKNEPK